MIVTIEILPGYLILLKLKTVSSKILCKRKLNWVAFKDINHFGKQVILNWFESIIWPLWKYFKCWCQNNFEVQLQFWTIPMLFHTKCSASFLKNGTASFLRIHLNIQTGFSKRIRISDMSYWWRNLYDIRNTLMQGCLFLKTI